MAKEIEKILDEMDSEREKKFSRDRMLRQCDGFRTEWNRYSEMILNEFGGYGE